MGTKISCSRCSTMVSAEDSACPHCGAEVDRAVTGATVVEGPPSLPGRYRVQQLLGRGGMGRVYLCRDLDLEVDVAVKVLPPTIASSPKALQRIESEAKVAARLRGRPGILSLYGFERHGESCILVMEYASGGSVFHRLRDQGRIPEAGCRRVGAEIADALAQAHDLGVLHRDIKPGNVLLDIHGRVKVGDFGLARVVDRAYVGTDDAPIEGTPVYMAPEVLRGDAVDGRSDLYSLGAMLFEMSTGEPPYRGSTREIVDAKRESDDPPPDPRRLHPGLSEEFSAIVRRLMDPDPARRFPGARDLAAALRGEAPSAQQAVPVATGPAGPPRAPLPPGERPPAPAAPGPPLAKIGVAAAVVLAALGTYLAVRSKGDGAPAGPGPSPAAPAPIAEATPRFDGIVVVTKPPGAEIFVDGAPAGTTREDEGLRLTGVSQGEPHTISARLQDYQPDEEKGVVWKKGEPRPPVVLRLVRSTGVLQLQGGRPLAAVTVSRDGAVVRQLSLRDDGKLPPDILETGDYAVEVTAKGFRPWRQTLRVSSASSAPVRVDLVEADGRLTVDSLPAGAEALLDGKPVGRTPLKSVATPPGKHVLSFEHPDASAKQVDVEIQGDADTDLGVVELPPLSTLDLSGLPEGVTAVFEGEPVKGVLKREPGVVMITFLRSRCRPQPVEVALQRGPNPLPDLGPWLPQQGKIDLAGVGDDTTFVVAGGQARTRPWATLDADPGVHTVLYAKAGFPLLPLTILVAPGETLRLPAATWVETRRPLSSPLKEAESAVEAGLDWLVRHQSPDGSWDCDKFESQCRRNKCGFPGSPSYDTGVTGLSILALLGARGSGVRIDGAAAWRGLEWLLRNQDPKGHYGPLITNHFIYNQSMALLAVAEGCRATGDPWLKHSAGRAAAFIQQCQNPYMAWRYGIRPQDNDTSITTWAILALAAVRDIGGDVDPACFEGAKAWLDKVTEPEYGRAGYTARGNGPARPEGLTERFPSDKSESMTAAAVITRLACGADLEDEFLKKGVDVCVRCPPVWDEAEGCIDFYYWYLGTRALRAAGGKPRWDKWWAALCRCLVDHQYLDRYDDRVGSWEPVDPWAADGGRVYTTAIGVLALEVPWRHGTAFKEEGPRTTLSLTSDPPGAEVYQGGWRLGATPLQKLPLPMGPVSLRLVHPDREEQTVEATVPPFQHLDLGKIALPTPSTFLDLSDLPKDATTTMDGRGVRGKVFLRPGAYRVVLHRQGQWPQTFIVPIARGETVRPPTVDWRASTDWDQAAVRGLPPPAAPLPASFATTPARQVLDGRGWWTRDRAELVLVPETAGADGKARPAFLMDRHEVTVGQFQAFCKEARATLPPQPGGIASRQPVVGVPIAAARAYAAWAGRRLPTLEEWERAAFGGARKTAAPPPGWPWGPSDQVLARNLKGNEDGQSGLCGVGLFPFGMSPCGCLDMVGNAAEWVEEGEIVGGSFQTEPRVRDIVLSKADPATAGFRCAMDIPVK